MVRQENLRLVVIFIFCFTFVLPAINLILFKYFGNISSLLMETRQERIVPFTFISLTYILVTFLFFFKLPFSDSFNKLMIVVTLLVVSATIATFFAKVSVHSLALWGLLGVLLPLCRASEGMTMVLVTGLVFVVAGVVMSARLYLDAHTPKEVLAGSAIGFAVGLSSMVVLY